MKDAYFTTLKAQRVHNVRRALKGEFNEIPEKELARAKEEAADLERGYSVMFSGHSGAPGPDCPF